MRVKAIQAETCLLIKMIQESGPILQGEVGAEQQAEGQAGYKHTGLGTVLSPQNCLCRYYRASPHVKKAGRELPHAAGAGRRDVRTSSAVLQELIETNNSTVLPLMKFF